VDPEVKIFVHILQPKSSLSRPHKPQNDVPLDRCRNTPPRPHVIPLHEISEGLSQIIRKLAQTLESWIVALKLRGDNGTSIR